MEKYEKKQVPIWHKECLTLAESAQYFGIGINKIRELTEEKGCDFVLFIGSKRLIKREKFISFLNDRVIL